MMTSSALSTRCDGLAWKVLHEGRGAIEVVVDLSSTPLVIVGAGGFGREVHDVVNAINACGSPYESDGPYDFLGFLDDGVPDPQRLQRRHARHLGPIDAAEGLSLETRYVIGVGSADSRSRIADRLDSVGLLATVLVHPQATLGDDVVLGQGTIICSHTSLTTNIRIGRHVHVNLNCTVGHDVVINDFVTVNPGATISGEVTLHRAVTVGTNAAVIQGLTVGAGTTVGAGAVVVRDLPPGVVATGVPARPR